LNETVPGGGASSRLGQLLDVAYNIEYGEECSEQSALNLIYLLGYSGPGQLRIFGPSNEKYHVRGGNDQIASGLAAALAEAIQYGHFLTRIERNSDGSYKLTFQTGTGTKVITAGRVVMAMPFSILRTINYTNAGFRPLKVQAIQQLGMGSNTKRHLQFRTRHWNTLRNNGDTYADTGYQNTWEATRAQAGISGILVNYNGGQIARAAGMTSAQTVLSSLEPVLPGLTAQWNGESQLENWPVYPLTLGSYSFWKKGQYTAFAGVEGEVEGNCHFCGEHTSIESQGYLNGAVETGERVSREIVTALGK
jgi:monoamine oxidase